MSAKAVYDPAREKRGTCTSCGAAIVWRYNLTSGKSSPWDEPVDDGGIRVWTSHWATCPTAAQHRKPR